MQGRGDGKEEHTHWISQSLSDTALPCVAARLSLLPVHSDFTFRRSKPCIIMQLSRKLIAFAFLAVILVAACQSTQNADRQTDRLQQTATSQRRLAAWRRADQRRL